MLMTTLMTQNVLLLLKNAVGNSVHLPPSVLSNLFLIIDGSIKRCFLVHCQSTCTKTFRVKGKVFEKQVP